eukprot:TRINITY_DN72278_c0_g1_i1.p1 TRINITY_DN72278_c0_g1~~TRINITY_DN72278_c0_g1_i1.p1  ORF type:complete len:333 (-),score=70.14 TRINITY_DN72278_c0_g1_i1:59-1057(-)
MLPIRLQGPGKVRVVCLFGSLFLVICGLLSFALSPATLGLSAVAVLAAATYATEKVEQRHPSAPCLLLLGAFAASTAAGVGIVNYHLHRAPYIDALAGRAYEGVSAAAPASAYADGGILGFRNDTLLDTSRALGLLSNDGRTYCVAPLLSSKAPGAATGAGPAGAQPTVQFWAVGIDCCGRRGDFTCDSAGEPGVRQALVVHDGEDNVASQILAPRTHYDEYLRATSAAASLHGLQAAKPSVLVRWTADPRALLERSFRTTILVWLGSTLLVSALLALAWCPLHRYYDEKVRMAFVGKNSFSGYSPASSPGGYSSTSTLPVARQDPYMRRRD